jgi:hypothetical protein
MIDVLGDDAELLFRPDVDNTTLGDAVRNRSLHAAPDCLVPVVPYTLTASS